MNCIVDIDPKKEIVGTISLWTTNHHTIKIV